MTVEDLRNRLRSAGIVRLSAAEWAGLSEHLAVLERYCTGVAGDLLIVQDETGLAAVEQPSPAEIVIRRLVDGKQAQRFVEQRLEEYERMWDGCGCKIDYYA